MEIIIAVALCILINILFYSSSNLDILFYKNEERLNLREKLSELKASSYVDAKNLVRRSMMDNIRMFTGIEEGDLVKGVVPLQNNSGEVIKVTVTGILSYSDEWGIVVKKAKLINKTPDKKLYKFMEKDVVNAITARGVFKGKIPNDAIKQVMKEGLEVEREFVVRDIRTFKKI